MPSKDQGQDTITKAVSALKQVPKDLGDLLEDPKTKNAAIGAGLAYLLSTDEKERNAIIGGLIGYYIGKKQEDKDGSF